jgi:hypothetical protein
VTIMCSGARSRVWSSHVFCVINLVISRERGPESSVSRGGNDQKKAPEGIKKMRKNCMKEMRVATPVVKGLK